MLNRILVARAILREQTQTVQPWERRYWEDDDEDSGGVWLEEGDEEEEEADNGGVLLSPEQLVRCWLYYFHGAMEKHGLSALEILERDGNNEMM